jgi:hypothetical protein
MLYPTELRGLEAGASSAPAFVVIYILSAPIDSPQIRADRGRWPLSSKASWRREWNPVDSLALKEQSRNISSVVIGGAGPGVKAIRRAYRHQPLLKLSGWRCGAMVLTILSAGAAVSCAARAEPASPSAELPLSVISAGAAYGRRHQ